VDPDGDIGTFDVNGSPEGIFNCFAGTNEECSTPSSMRSVGLWDSTISCGAT